MIFDNSIRNGGLIVDMKMPKCCDDCDANYDSCACGISGKAWYRNPRYPGFDPGKERMPDCPIKGEIVPCSMCVHKDAADRGMCMYDANICIGGRRKDG